MRRGLCVGRMLRLGIVLMNSGHDRRTGPSRTSRRGRQSDDLAAGSVVPLEWTTMYPFSGCRSFVTGASSWRTSRRRTGGRLRGGEGSLPWFLLLLYEVLLSTVALCHAFLTQPGRHTGHPALARGCRPASRGLSPDLKTLMADYGAVSTMSTRPSRHDGMNETPRCVLRRCAVLMPW